MTKKQFILLCGAVLLLGGGFFLSATLRKLKISVPDYQEPGELVFLDQGWTGAQRLRFHHTAQGTRLIPFAWFLALEQPCYSPFGCKPFADQSYLGRFGFLASKPDPDLNPAGLPVGFAVQKDFHDPDSKTTYPVVGLNCAACHTGQLRYGKYAVLIEGAPAMIEVTQFQKALGVALIFTKLLPLRYGRFETKVLGPNASDEQKRILKQRFADFLTNAKWEKDATDARNTYANQAGFARTDALTRIGNQVFAVDMKNADNFATSKAAVRFPQIWDASWFDWVQYNSSIADPLVRNIGEAMGVRAAAKLYGANASDFDNSVDVRGLIMLEQMLSGPGPYQGLTSPKWPSVFPPIDRAKAARGADLYKQHCQGCHLPPPGDLVADLNSKQPLHWREYQQGKRFLKVTDVKVDQIGTDPNEAMDFINRTADTGALNRGRVTAGQGLELVTRGIAGKFFEKAAFTPDQRLEVSGFRDPSAPAVRSYPIYKARPLNGIWAVAPYLHNGSVPTLYELLSPQGERPNSFWLGTKEFDPVKVGYDGSKIEGGYRYDVTTPGNSNQGHLFTDGPRGKGVIGPSLPPEDRWALIEYLKSI